MKNTSLILLLSLSCGSHATLQKPPIQLPPFLFEKMTPKIQKHLNKKQVRQQTAPYYAYPRVNNPLLIGAQSIEIAPFDQTGLMNISQENGQMFMTYNSAEPPFMLKETINKENVQELFEYLKQVIEKHHREYDQQAFFTPQLQTVLSENFLEGVNNLPDTTERDRTLNIDEATDIKWVDVTPATREHEYRFLCGHLQATLYLPLGTKEQPTITWESLDPEETSDHRLIQPESDLTLKEMFMLLIVLQKAVDNQQYGALSSSQQDLLLKLQEKAEENT